MDNKTKAELDALDKAVEDVINNAIENDPIIKQCYEDQGGCFKNIIVPSIMNSESKIASMIAMLASQAIIYDKLLNNIAQYGDKELIKKCNDDITKVFTQK
jgi:hypothetical protein